MEFTALESILGYVAIVLSATFLMHIADQNGRYQKFFIFLVYLIMTLPLACRYNTGLDYLGYTNTYNHVLRSGSMADSYAWAPGIEYTYRVLIFLSHDLLNSPQLIFIFYAVVTNFFILLGIYYYRKETSMASMIFLYMCFFYLLSFNVMRQMTAIAIIFFASRYIMEKKIIKYIIFFLLAVCIHASAIMAIALYLMGVENARFQKFLRILQWLVPLVIVFFIQQAIQMAIALGALSKYENYNVVKDGMTVGFGLVIYLTMLVLYVIHYRLNHLDGTKRTQQVMLHMLAFGVMNLLLGYRMEGDVSRLGLYFTMFNIVSYSLLATGGNRREKGIKYEYQLLPYAAAILDFVITGLIHDGHGCIPYSLWLGI
jgi:hypothetical protein